MTKTIHGVASELREALIEYIEATYHIGDPALLKQRRTLLEEIGVVHQSPFLESTPRYQTGEKFGDIKRLSPAARALFETLSQPTAKGKQLLYDPPYTHQSKAIRETLVEGKNLLIMTGTGSGKTESFLMPILGMLAKEAQSSPEAFGTQSGMRAMILYPMNALVNDQLGRLRGIFGDPRLVEMFMGWADRPPRFARYTSRTPYAGKRLKAKDQARLKQFGDFYVKALERAAADDEDAAIAARMIEDLKSRGKWPAKPDLSRWYKGPKGNYWQDAAGNFIRAITLPGDSELLTRHESQSAAPDLLVTNYSMLEYMLMRPVERTIFDQTKARLAANPDENFLLILDESHLYRGAGGAEVGLLLRRLRDRLDIPIERFQVICATASFDSPEYAPEFASQLTGAPPESFTVIQGDYLKQLHGGQGSAAQAELLAGLDMSGFYSEEPAKRAESVAPFLAAQSTPLDPGNIDRSLFAALSNFPPLIALVNKTMGDAQPVNDLGLFVFPDSPKPVADLALTNLGALATSARKKPDDPSLLPCRVHNFFRGLRGLWACMDPDCSGIDESLRGAVGKLYTQPRDLCAACNARVLELFTCRVCGSAYARGYCDNVEKPSVIWSEAGAPLRMGDDSIEELDILDILLVKPGNSDLAEEASFDLTTGQINSPLKNQRERSVYLSPHRIAQSVQDDDDDDGGGGGYLASAGVFHQCGICERKSYQGRSSVQDHETKGDQPFQVLVSRQIQVQPPGPQPATSFAPLRGRKVLAFSDSRQVAARLAPNLQMYSARDTLRPLMVRGWTRLAQIPKLPLSLEHLYPAVLIAASELGVRFRPELTMQEKLQDFTDAGHVVKPGLNVSDDDLRALCSQLVPGEPPEAFLSDLMSTMRDRSLGLEALAFASIVEHQAQRAAVEALPNIAGVTETAQDRVELARAWIREWNGAGFWLRNMPGRWYQIHPDKKVQITSRTGKFRRFESRLGSSTAKKAFNEKWLPKLLDVFTTKMEGKKHQLQGRRLSLAFGGEWVRCADCKSVHRPVRLLPVCLDCGHASIFALDPNADEVFMKRKGYYRNSVIAALLPDAQAPVSIIAAEHTAQLNSAEHDDVFSKAEENELLFQDVDIPVRNARSAPSAVDVLSSTTTMEVGIDIGQLSGVALRNMPPSRANYQQRAGRAGRRGNAIATVVAFGGSDTHDEHFFSEPAKMISGEVIDPTLSIDNPDIVCRHIRAFLLQSYHQARIPADYVGKGDLFSVLGQVSDFALSGSVLNRADFETWLNANADRLRSRVDAWIPSELPAQDRQTLLEWMIEDCLDAIDRAIEDDLAAAAALVGAAAVANGDEEDEHPEVPAEVDEEKPVNPPDARSLLDALLYKGVLPRYAFPTDVATFHVFDVEGSTKYRPKLKFAPAQGLAVALTQYATGKQVWIAGKCYTSGAIYSSMPGERYKQWDGRKLHVECTRCGYARTELVDAGLKRGDVMDCPACQGSQTLGPARYWMRPTGFAHPITVPEVTSPDDIPETSYATRAKLTMESPDDSKWVMQSERVRHLAVRTHLLVSNTGPAKQGYLYCTRCGRIEATTTPHSPLLQEHSKPYPDPADQTCKGGAAAREVVLGTDFITDVALFSFRLEDPIRLHAAASITRVALRTLCEALARAATDLLGIEPGEILAEYRPAVTQLGNEGLEAEIFLYDTLPGGAGFSGAAAAEGLPLFQKALDIMKSCEEHCDLSCYRCLRSFRNRLDHGALDRFTGIALLEYLLAGKLSSFEPRRISSAANSLFTDLLRHDKPYLQPVTLDDLTDDQLKPHHKPTLVTSATGKPVLLAVVSPLEEFQAPRQVDGILPDGGSALLVQISELLVRQNLPKATQFALGQIATA